MENKKEELSLLQRLENEQVNLAENIEKLKKFIESDKIYEVEEIQDVLLRVQLKAMETYNECLHQRISLFYLKN